MDNELRIVQESLHYSGAEDIFYDMQVCQEASQRKGYMTAVYEALRTNNGKAALLQKLYSDIVQKAIFDTALIDASKGAFTKFKGYKNTISALETLEDLYEAEDSSKVKQGLTDLSTIRSLITQLEVNRKYFENGYRMNEFVTMMVYRTTVLNILELINVCTVTYMLTVRGKAEENGVKPGEMKAVRRNSATLLASFNNGNFTKVAKVVLKETKTPGQEALAAPLAAIQAAGTALAGGISTVGTIIAAGAAIIIAALVIFHAIRISVYYFFAANAKVESWLSTQAELVRYNSDLNPSDASNIKKANTAKKLESIARFIRVKILKTETVSDKIEKTTNQTTYSQDEMLNIAEKAEYDEDVTGGFTF